MMAAAAPPIPHIGDVDNNVAWCGGEPNIAWTQTARGNPASPYAKRYTDKNEMTVYQAMTTVLETKLKRNDPSYTLVSFTEDVKAHFVKCGMDSIFYLVDPRDPNRRLDLLLKHPMFDLSTVKTEMNVMTGVIAWANCPALFSNVANAYDEYDAHNQTTARECLLRSLDKTLRHTIRPRITSDMLATEVWMVITSEIMSGSYRAMESKKEELRQLSLKDFPGEVVRSMNAEIIRLCAELEAGNRLPGAGTVTRDLHVEYITYALERHFIAVYRHYDLGTDKLRNNIVSPYLRCFTQLVPFNMANYRCGDFLLERHILHMAAHYSDVSSEFSFDQSSLSPIESNSPSSPNVRDANV